MREKTPVNIVYLDWASDKKAVLFVGMAIG
jgi:hypothetical protein